MKRLAALVALFPLIVLTGLVSQGCASMGTPLHVACLACATLEASGVCGAARTAATPECPAGEELWITNYRSFVERGAAPQIECKARRQSDLP